MHFAQVVVFAEARWATEPASVQDVTVVICGHDMLFASCKAN